MSMFDIIFAITFGQIMAGFGAAFIIFGAISLSLWYVNYIINWKWWKKEYRKDMSYWIYFTEHREEIKQIIEGRGDSKL